MKGKVAIVGAAAVLAAAATIVKPWEGKVNEVYPDIIGVPTVCYGHTGRDVRIGQAIRSNAECDRLLAGDLSESQGYVRRCITRPLPPSTEAALVSFVFNVGPSGVCGSTLQRHMQAGNIAQGCGQLMRWVNAGGKRVQGLVNRRQAEYRVCMKGLSEQ